MHYENTPDRSRQALSLCFETNTAAQKDLCILGSSCSTPDRAAQSVSPKIAHSPEDVHTYFVPDWDTDRLIRKNG